MLCVHGTDVRISYLAGLDKVGIVIDHPTFLENHQLLGKVQRGDWSHRRFQALAELVLECLLIAHRDVVGWKDTLSVSRVSDRLYLFLTLLKHLELVELADRLRVESNGTLVVFVVVLDQILHQLASV
jgi:hypothetical protein